MANESKYRIIGIDVDYNEPDTVLPAFACPKCSNNQVDTLEINDDNVKCLNCDYEYQI